jgi:hypothetical protein
MVMAVEITLDTDPLTKSKAFFDMKSRDTGMPLAPPEREQKAESLIPLSVEIFH